MKRLRGLFGNSSILLLAILALMIVVILLASGRAIHGFGDRTTTATTQDATAEQKREVVVFQSSLPLSTPVPTPTTLPSIKSLKVIATDPVENGPYENIAWSPDSKKALVTKQRTQYILARDRSALVEKFPPRVIPSTAIDLGDLWLLDLATGKERQLLKQVRHYTWSPDSIQVAYMAPTEAEGIGRALYVLDIASGESRRVVEVDFLGSEYPPQWLPSGEIVYVRDGQLRSVKAEDRVEKTLPGFKSFGRVTIEAGQMVYLTGPDAPLGFHLSPDGKRVAYKTYLTNKRTIAYRLWLANADGSAAKLITEQAEGGYYEWSPNSEWLVFNTFRDVDDPTVDQHDPGLRGLWAVRNDGSEVHALYRTDGWREILSPTWSPDSAMVIFIQSRYIAEGKEGRDLWIANVAEKETASLLPGSNEAQQMIRLVWWSPDGHYLFTLSDAPGHGGMPRQYWYKSNRLTLTTK